VHTAIANHARLFLSLEPFNFISTLFLGVLC
jgi:hypothetical protein